MVQPVTGPFFKRVQTNSTLGVMPGDGSNNPPPGRVTVERNLERTWFRQKPPFSLPLAFSYTDRRLTVATLSGPTGWESADYTSAPLPPPTNDYAYNRAYSNFKNGLGEAASLSVTIAERRQAVSMIAKRATQLAAFGLALKKLDFKRAAKALDISNKDVRRRLGRGGRKLVNKRGRKAFANNYLEFHFGWAPLVNDIGSAIDVLQGGIPPALVRGSGMHNWQTTSISDGGYWRDRSITRFTQQVRIRAQVRVDNPNLWLANQMGFVNPASVAWELVPFSFVVDWFVNVGDILASYTDFAGLSIENASTTVFSTGETQYSGTWDYPNGSIIRNRVGKTIACTRSVGVISPPRFGFKPFQGFSVRRGLAAISLLVQSVKT